MEGKSEELLLSVQTFYFPFIHEWELTSLLMIFQSIRLIYLSAPKLADESLRIGFKSVKRFNSHRPTPKKSRCLSSIFSL